MDAAADIGMLGAAFEHPGEASQSIFRAALEAFSRPGTVVAAEHTAQWPRGIGQAAGAVLLALLDQDTRLWVSSSPHASVIASYLRFHTGCTVADSPGEADFAFVDDPVRLPALADFSAGSEIYPDRSATVVVEVAAIDGHGWILTGPGIEQRAAMAVALPGPRFMAQWRAQRRRFPCGVDMVLACGERFVALPRTTTIEEA